MARKPSKGLFNLIKALKQSEARYIRLNLNLYSGEKYNTHLRLFELVSSQKKFDESSIKKKLYPGKVNSNTFSEVKKYLYHFILKNLVSYDEANSVDLRIKTGLQKVRVLYKRGLIKECSALIESLFKLVREANDSNSILELYDWQMKMAYVTMDVQFLIHKSSVIDQEVASTTARITHIHTLKNIYYSLFTRRIQYSERMDTEVKNEIKKMVEPIIEQPVSEKYEEQKWIYKILSYYYLLTNQKEEYYTICKALYKLVKSNKYEFREYPGEVIPLISSLLLACNQLSKYDEVAKYIPEYLDLLDSKSIGVTDKNRAICSYHINQLIHFNLQGKFLEAAELANNFLNKYPLPVYRTYLVNFSLVFVDTYFGSGNYSKALEWANKIDEVKSTLRKDIQAVVRCMSLVIHYELSNHLIIDSLSRSASRYIKKDFELQSFEVRLIKTLKALTNPVLSKKERKRIFMNFYNDIEVLISEDQQKAIYLIMINAWAKSKIDNTSIAEIFKTNYDMTKK